MIHYLVQNIVKQRLQHCCVVEFEQTIIFRDPQSTKLIKFSYYSSILSNQLSTSGLKSQFIHRCLCFMFEWMCLITNGNSFKVNFKTNLVCKSSKFLRHIAIEVLWVAKEKRKACQNPSENQHLDVKQIQTASHIKSQNSQHKDVDKHVANTRLSQPFQTLVLAFSTSLSPFDR